MARGTLKVRREAEVEDEWSVLVERWRDGWYWWTEGSGPNGPYRHEDSARLAAVQWYCDRRGILVAYRHERD